jgi:hypothetical protein
MPRTMVPTSWGFAESVPSTGEVSIWTLKGEHRQYTARGGFTGFKVIPSLRHIMKTVYVL